MTVIPLRRRRKLTLLFCFETTPQLVLASDSTALPMLAFVSDNNNNNNQNNYFKIKIKKDNLNYSKNKTTSE